MSQPPVQHPVTGVDRLAGAFSWVLLPTVVVLGLVDATRSVPGLTRVPLHLVGVALLALVGTGLLAARLRSRRSLPPQYRAGLGLLLTFLALVGYATVTTLHGTRVLFGPGRPPTVITVPLDIVRTPLLEAALTVWCGWLLVALTPPGALLRRLWFTFVVVAPISLIGYLRQLPGLGVGARLRTGMGGAATYHVVLLLGLAVMVAAASSGLHRRWSQGLAALFVVMILMTGARAGFVTLALFGLLSLARAARSGAATRPGWRVSARWLLAAAVGVVAVGVAFVLSPLSRRLDGDTHSRLATWQLGWDLVSSSAGRLLTGLGSGVVWPWYAFESGFRPSPYRSRVSGPFGWTLTNPHSLYVEVFTELGLIGAALLLALIVGMVRTRLQVARTSVPAVLLDAVLVSLVAFAFDLYLLKSFPVALLWWTVLFAAVSLSSSSPASDEGSRGPADEPLHSPA